MTKKKILFVCLGNICRSPVAEGIMIKKLEEKGLSNNFIIDSAGTSGYHKGELPDSRMRAAASKRGYNLTHHSRPVVEKDFDEFDFILAMDDNNIYDLKAKAPSVEAEQKIIRATDYCQNLNVDYVPDPYYGGAEGFDHVIDILEDACEGLIKRLTSE